MDLDRIPALAEQADPPELGNETDDLDFLTIDETLHWDPR